MSAHNHPPTSAEIDRRLRIVAELRNLCLSLGQARRMANAPPSDGDGSEPPSEWPAQEEASLEPRGENA